MAHDLPQLTDALGPQDAMTSEVVTTRTARIHVGSDGIVYVVNHAGSRQRLEDAIEAVGVIARLGGGRRLPVLVDMRAMKAIDRAARAYYAGPATATCYAAAALLVASPLSRAIGNFFVGLNKPLISTQLFADEKQALAWLSTHRE